MRTEIGSIAINWIPILNDLVGGFAIGTGMVLAFVLWYGVINKAAGKGKKEGEQ